MILLLMLTIAKFRQNLNFKKIVKLTDDTYPYNSLTNFECEAHIQGWKGESYFEKFVKLQ